MTTQQDIDGLLAAVCADPWDDVTRAVAADALREMGRDFHAELLTRDLIGREVLQRVYNRDLRRAQIVRMIEFKATLRMSPPPRWQITTFQGLLVYSDKMVWGKFPAWLGSFLMTAHHEKEGGAVECDFISVGEYIDVSWR